QREREIAPGQLLGDQHAGHRAALAAAPRRLRQRVGDESELVRGREQLVGELGRLLALARERAHLVLRELAHRVDDELLLVAGLEVDHGILRASVLRWFGPAVIRGGNGRTAFEAVLPMDLPARGRPDGLRSPSAPSARSLSRALGEAVPTPFSVGGSRSDPLDDRGDAHAAADAHGDEAALQVAALELVED